VIERIAAGATMRREAIGAFLFFLATGTALHAQPASVARSTGAYTQNSDVNEPADCGAANECALRVAERVAFEPGSNRQLTQRDMISLLLLLSERPQNSGLQH
jgi:hypothetical protein